MVGLKVLKNKLSQYVRLAAQGETVLVSDRDRVVAELVPPQHHRGTLVADAVIAQMVRSGRLTPALFPPGPPPEAPPVASHDQILRELAADREDR